MQLALTASGIYSAHSDYAEVKVVGPGHIQLLFRDAH